MDEDLYDEFGNPLNEISESGDSESEVETTQHNVVEDDEMTDHGAQVVVHQDQALIPSLRQTFGDDVETIIQTTDTQDISVPVITPPNTTTFSIEEKELPETSYSKQYMCDLMMSAGKVRNVAVAGALHSGKTSFLDMLIKQTHFLPSVNRYTDYHKLEQERGVSLKATIMSLLLPTLSGTSIVSHIVDVPGHVNFQDELAVALCTADSVAVVVDVVEGLTLGTELVLDRCLREDKPVFIVLSKLDRLLLELRLPPVDSYFKIRRIIQEINTFCKQSAHGNAYSHTRVFSPELNNVCFSSAKLGFCFNLKSFAAIYKSNKMPDIDVDEFSTRLWGDVYFAEGKLTSQKGTATSSDRSFVRFVLEPLYKIASNCLTKTPPEASMWLAHNYNVKVSSAALDKDYNEAVARAMSAFFSDSPLGFTDTLEKLMPSPLDVIHGSGNSAFEKEIKSCDPTGPLVAQVTKFLDTRQANGDFFAVVRVNSGCLRTDSIVTLLGENFSSQFDEDVFEVQIKQLYISDTRYRIPVSHIPAGSIGLIGGTEISKLISKSGTLLGPEFTQEQWASLKKIDYGPPPALKVALQPINPSELPKFLAALRILGKSYPGCEVKVEESGEHVLLGSGELYLDCALHDLRTLYSGIEIRVSNPLTKFAETVVDSSFAKIAVESANNKNSIVIIAEPMEEELVKDITQKTVPSMTENSARQVAAHFRNRYGWDALKARSIWCFGPNECGGASLLLDDTLEEEVDKSQLLKVKDSIIQGFFWACREGPLCDEPIRNMIFKIIEINLSENPLESNGGQLIPMTRQACYAAFMTSSPRIMEPIYKIEVISTTSEIAEGLSLLLEKRRGAIMNDQPIMGTPLYKYQGVVPVIDSVGLETDIRTMSQGSALPCLVFSHWGIAPGDPLDKECFIPSLRPAPIKSLARDFVIKTRKRKGISGAPQLRNYINEDVFQSLKENNYIEE